METRSSAKVELVPWDYESAAHCDRIFRQREACGWKSEEVEMWRDKSRNGTKMLYWIVYDFPFPVFGINSTGYTLTLDTDPIRRLPRP